MPNHHLYTYIGSTKVCVAFSAPNCRGEFDRFYVKILSQSGGKTEYLEKPSTPSQKFCVT